MYRAICCNSMQITDPILTPDVSVWCDHIHAAEFAAAGCGSVVVGLYPEWANGKKLLHHTSLAQCRAVTSSNLLLQAYYWDDITYDPIGQANWVVQVVKDNSLPVKWIWADQEQWWTDWAKWGQSRQGNIPASAVPKATPFNISSHYQNFMVQLHANFPQSGVYTNNGFVTSYAPGMNAWLMNYKAWVAQYVGQPKEATPMTWDYFKAHYLPNYDIALASGQLPKNVVGHQFTGDSCILPGSYNPQGQAMALDVSMFSKAFLDSLKSPQEAPQPPIPPHPTICPTCGQNWP